MNRLAVRTFTVATLTGAATGLLGGFGHGLLALVCALVGVLAVLHLSLDPPWADGARRVRAAALDLTTRRAAAPARQVPATRAPARAAVGVPWARRRRAATVPEGVGAGVPERV